LQPVDEVAAETSKWIDDHTLIYLFAIYSMGGRWSG